MKLLNETQAAIHLGITKELLYAYVRNEPKGDGRTLNTVIKDGKNYFDESELDAFDKFLKQPWAKPGEKRPSIPTYIKDYLKTEIQGKCPITGKGYPLEDAHIVDYAECLNHHHHNLIRICSEVHTKADNKVVPKEILKETKRQLIGTLKQRLLQEDAGYRRSFAPPNPNYFFVGRMEELLDLTEAMEFNRMVVVQGIGGIGKTQLLLNAFDNVRYHQPVLWIDADAISSINDLVLVLSNALSEVLGHVVNQSLVDSLRGVQLTIALDSMEKLLIAQRDETEDFIHSLMTQTDGIQLLITSQIDLSIFQDQKVVINLEGLNDASSKAVLINSVHDQVDVVEDKLDWLVNFCAGHPLSLKIASSLLEFYKSVDLVTEQLQKHDALKQPMRRSHNKENTLSVCLDTVYESLTNSQKKLLHIAKFYPGGVKLKYLEKDFGNLHKDISTLRQFFLISTIKDPLEIERYSISNPVGKFMFDKAQIESKDHGVILQKDQLINIMIEANVIAKHYIESAMYGPISHGIMRMESELPNIINAFRITQHMISLSKKRFEKDEEQEYLRVLAGIAGALGKYCFTRDQYDYGTMLSKAGIEANVALGEISSASTQYVYLAQLQLRRYDFDAFEKTCQELCALAKSTKNTHAQRDCFWMKGRLDLSKNKFRSAIDLFQNAKEFLTQEYEEEKLKDPDDKMVDVSILGNIALLDSEIAHAYSDLGDFENAINHYNKAIEKQEEINDEANLMSCYHQLANAMTSMGDMNGFSYYFKAIEGFQRNGQFEYLANSISELGRFVMEHPDLAQHPLIDHDAIKNTLESLAYQFNDIFSRQQGGNNKNLNPDSIPFDLLGKGILIMKLVSFSDFSNLLFDWAEKFRGKIEDNSKPSYFTAFLNVAHIVGGFGIEKPKPNDKNKVMKYLLQSVLIFNGGPDLESQTFIFYWLAAWMKYKKIDPDATAEKLLKAAWDSFED